MSHQRVQWLADGRAKQEVDPSDIKLISTELIVDQTHAQKWKQSSECTIFELATLVHCDKFTTEILTTFSIERRVKDAVGLRDVEGIREQWVQGHISIKLNILIINN